MSKDSLVISEEMDKDVQEFGSYLDELLSTGFNHLDLDDEDDENLSDCCGAELMYNDQLCGDCKEHV